MRRRYFDSRKFIKFFNMAYVQSCYLILLSKILIIYIQKKRRLTAACPSLEPSSFSSSLYWPFFSFLTTLLPYYCRLVIGAIIHHQGRTWYTVMCKHLKKVQPEEISKAKINIFRAFFFSNEKQVSYSYTFPFHMKKILSIPRFWYLISCIVDFFTCFTHENTPQNSYVIS